MLLVGRQEGHPACKKREWWGAGVVICLEQGADLHMAQLVPLPLTVCCFTKIQIGFTFLVPVHVGSPGKRASYVCAKLSGIHLLLTEVLCGEVLLLCLCVCLSVCVLDVAPLTVSQASYVCAKLSGVHLLLTEVLCGEVLLLCTVSVCLSVCLCVRCGAVDFISGQLRLC